MCKNDDLLKKSSASRSLKTEYRSALARCESLRSATMQANHLNLRSRKISIMKELFTVEKLNEAKENAVKADKQRTARANELSNKTAFNSLIYSKQKQCVSETALIDFCLIIASANTQQFHQSQVLELLKLVDCKRKTVAAHVKDKQNVFADLLTVDNENVFTVHNQQVFIDIMSMSEFQQQLMRYAEKLYIAFFDEEHMNDLHAEALKMNKQSTKRSTKRSTKKTANS